MEGSRQKMFELQAKERALAEGLVGSWLMPFSSRMKRMRPEDMERFQASAESRRKKFTFLCLRGDTV